MFTNYAVTGFLDFVFVDGVFDAFFAEAPLDVLDVAVVAPNLGTLACAEKDVVVCEEDGVVY